jgi:hypothetical protein
MPKEYRAHILDTDDRVLGQVILTCNTEDEARERASRLSATNAVTLWDGARRLARFTAKKTNGRQPYACGEPAELQVGDRVRLNEAGRRASPRMRSGTGVVAGLRGGGNSLDILFDGNRQPTRMHKSYVERIADDHQPKI